MRRPTSRREPLLDVAVVLAYLVLAVYAFAMILAAVCYYNVCAKRFRDRGRRGLWAAVLPLAVLLTGALDWFIPRSLGDVPAWWGPVALVVLLVLASGTCSTSASGRRRRRDADRPMTDSPAAPPSATAILQALLRCPSITPAEGGALDVLQELLEPAGFTVHRLRFSEAGQPDVDNLYARIGTAAPHLVFAGHTDVVPPGDAASWRFPPFSGEVADGRIWGRGACDMKGGVAAAVAAVLAHLAHAGAPEGSISFLITGDEEGPAVNGTPKLLDWARDRGERFDHCVLGEPTNPTRLGEMIKIGRRGSLTGEIVVEGRQGHVAYPHLADNPIPRLMLLLAALKAEPLDAGTAHFDPSNLEVVTVDTGNPSANVIPAEARARFNIRFNDVWSPETLQAETPPPAGRRAGRRASPDLRTLQRPGVPDRAGAIRDALRGRRRSRDRPSPRAFRRRAGPRMPASSRGIARSSSSGSSAPRCMPSTSTSRSTISTSFKPSTARSSTDISTHHPHRRTRLFKLDRRLCSRPQQTTCRDLARSSLRLRQALPSRSS